LIAGAPDPGNPTSIGEDEIASWQHQPGVTILGHVEHVSELWQRSHIAVLPSRREGLPMSLLEAAACGLPMVATDVPGCRELVKDGETGFLVPADDATALAQAIERLAISKELRVRMGVSARKSAAEHFSSEIVGCMIVAVYDQLLNTRASKNA
jgi:glycosyltransferase involved in cell wall biosynthesis